MIIQLFRCRKRTSKITKCGRPRANFDGREFFRRHFWKTNSHRSSPIHRKNRSSSRWVIMIMITMIVITLNFNSNENRNNTSKPVFSIDWISNLRDVNKLKKVTAKINFGKPYHVMWYRTIVSKRASLKYQEFKNN